jgi:chromosome segregation ATPase
MEVTLDTILGILGLFIGGGGGAFFTWRWQRKKAKAEAKTAEADAAKELQDVYQQLVQDIKTDRDEQKAYIQELKEDRSHLRKDRDDLRKRQDELEEQVRGLQREVARNGRMVANMRPFLCGLLACKNRTPVTISEDAEIETEPKTQIS